MTILRRGRDSTAVYGILEGYLLLGGVAVLQGHEATLAAALQSTLSKLLQTLMSPAQPAQPAGSPPSRPGGTISCPHSAAHLSQPVHLVLCAY